MLVAVDLGAAQTGARHGVYLPAFALSPLRTIVRDHGHAGGVANYHGVARLRSGFAAAPEEEQGRKQSEGDSRKCRGWVGDIASTRHTSNRQRLQQRIFRVEVVQHRDLCRQVIRKIVQPSA